MPIIKMKSSKAMPEDSKPGSPEGFAAAVSVKRKPKKKMMAQGGNVGEPDLGIGNDPIPQRGFSKQHEDNSKSIKNANDSYAGVDKKADAKRALKDSGYAKGGVVKLPGPKMAPSDVFSTKLRDQEAHLMDMAPMKHDGMSEDKGPDEDEYMANHFAKGGMINGKVSMSAAEEDEVEHPAGLESDNDQIKPSDEEIMADHFAHGGAVNDTVKPPSADDRPDRGWGAIIFKADGGMVDESEMDEDEHASIAAAIMAKRRKMADGGMVDIESNEEEQPNEYDSRNQAILKEHYGDDLDDIHQPMDSNEHGDVLEDEDSHDMVSMIRRKMKSVRK